MIDLNPGCGLWSKSLHDAVQPRKHIMMDSSAEAYRPFMDDIVKDRPNIEIIPRSGIVWSSLNKMLEEKLDPARHPLVQPHQDVLPGNDALLVTANLSTYPKKKVYLFDSLSKMVLYQLLSSIRTSSLFQRYGLVRMLLWVNDEEKLDVLPRTLTLRKRSAFEAELLCDWIHEVAGFDNPVRSAIHLRDEWQDVESAATTLQRMEKSGITTPKGRETALLKRAMDDRSLLGQELAGVRPPRLLRPFTKELSQLESEAKDVEPEDNTRLKHLRMRDRFACKINQTYLELLQLRNSALRMDPDTPEFAAADRDFADRIANFRKNQRQEFAQVRDSQHAFRNQGEGNPPALMWDRRQYEPLAVDPAADFYPNVPTALLDIQPKTSDPLLRRHGAAYDYAGDISDVLIRGLFSQWSSPVFPRSTDVLWPGFTEVVEKRCPSLRDAKRGGSPMTGPGSLHVRAMNEHHLLELLRAWTDWPFKPTYSQLVGRLVNDADPMQVDDEDGVLGNAMGGP